MSNTKALELPWRLSGPALTALLVLRLAIGWHFFYEGISKLLATGWTSAGYLSSAEGLFGPLFQAMAGAPWMVRTADLVTAWGLTLIGLCLVLGAWTRATSIAMMPSGLLWGLDRLILRRRLPRPAESDISDTVPSSGRRELLKDLAGVPVLGALATTVFGIYAAADKTPAVDALSGATPLLSPAPAFGKTGNIVSVRDFERLAPSYMTPGNWAYVSGGAGDEKTLRWNEAAFREIHLRLRVIDAQTKPDTRLVLLGRELPHPIMLAPARQGDLYPEGELATVRGAGEAGAVSIISSMAKPSIASIAEAASRPVWYQAYLFKDRERARDNVQQAEAAGYEAICVTMDSSSNGPRDRQLRHGSRRNADALREYRDNPFTWPTTWKDFEWYRSLTKLPVMPKGIMTADDAQRALDLGADGIYISNHGARNFDSGIAPIQVLPAITEQVAGRVPIILDGGIRRGTDVLKVLTLGATAVAIGRPYLYGLVVDGSDGVAAVINMLRNELEMAMVSTWQTNIATLDKDAILSLRSILSKSTFFSS